MNIVYSSSDSYAPIAGVSLYSLLKNNKQCKELSVFIIDNNISEKIKKNSQRFALNLTDRCTLCRLQTLKNLQAQVLT